ncbi:MAG: hypothetical protein EXS37_03020 [Opitutus sp.]|nr:hypothetical protein [Opitutus sp.]
MSSHPIRARPFRPDHRHLGAWMVGLVLCGIAAAQDSGFSGMDTRSQYREMRSEALPIFFPPNPPPIDRPIARSTAPAGRYPAPPELALYVNELFYPPLGTRIHTKTLSEKLRLRVEQYHAAKVALQNELRAELERLRDTDRATRLTELNAFSQRQAPRIAELENTAEQLRRDLITSEQSWSAVRQWRLGDNDRRGFSPVEIAQVMRGYAFYQSGLLPAQRRLLREISIELAMASDSTENATTAQPYLFFPPEPARVLLPNDLPADVAAKIAAYQTQKSRIKKELYDAVYKYDGLKLAFLRPNALKALAEKQTPTLGELDRLAEEIRLALTQVAEPAAIAERSPLPPVLHGRVTELMANYASVQKDAGAQVETVIAGARGLPMQATYRFDGDGLKFIVIPTRGARGGPPGGGPSGGPGGVPSADVLARITEVRTQISAIAETYGKRVAELINEKDAIRKDVAQTMGTTKAQTLDNALYAAMRVATARETEGLYRDYRVAVFQPGLSPAQRQLLFDGVVERLNLPLPRGELQPISRGNSW